MSTTENGHVGRGRLACVYVTDRGFLPCTCFSIATLARNSTVPLDIYVLHVDLGASDLAEARDYLASVGATVELIALDTADIEGLSRSRLLPAATYGRLLMHRFLPRQLERALYIDGDTLVDIDVAPLATHALDGTILGAVLDIGRILVGRREEAQVRLDLGPDGDYFNAGVLLIDWNQWCDLHVGEECLRAILSESQRFTQRDQCALNYICRGRWSKLDLVWNYQPACVLYGDRTEALFHFLGGRKPWRTNHLRHPMRFVKRYQAMYEASPWADEFKAPVLPYAVSEVMRSGKRALSTRHWKDGSLYRKLAQVS